MASILLLNKPFNTLCQFTDKDGRQTLANYIDVKQFKHYYPAGRLDYDSEGLVALTDNGALQHRLANPQFKLPKTYWVQVEGEVLSAQLHALQAGPLLNDGPTKPCKARKSIGLHRFGYRFTCIDGVFYGIERCGHCSAINPKTQCFCRKA